MEINQKTLKKLADIDIHVWLKYYNIKNEVGLPIDFREHLFLYDIYQDFSPKLVIMKAAQIGATTMEIIKKLWGIRSMKMDGIYCLPTDSDVNTLVGGKVNRIIAQNPILQEWVKDKDSIEQKQIGNNFIYYRGTWTKKAAIMVTSDWNSYDEIDASKPDVIEQYSTRLQHSKHKFEHYFSHPSSEGFGVDKFWQLSDQKHWFVTCETCSKSQFLKWPESIDPIRRVFQCKYCFSGLSDNARRRGNWVAKYRERSYSGYWVPLLICPWVTAGEIIDYSTDKSEEYFYNKVLGLPYVGGGNKLTKALFMRNLTKDMLMPEKNDRVVIGVDTGKKIHFVAGTDGGLFSYGESSDYDEIENMLVRWPRAVAVIDQGGDLIGSRKLREKYPGRVFLCSYGSDRKTGELVRWGQKDEWGVVVADRNRMIQMVVDEFSDKLIPAYGSENDWYDYWLHWNNLTRIKEENDRGVIRKVWIRNGDDHWAHATTYWRVGISRFAGTGDIIRTDGTKPPKSYRIQPNKTVSTDLTKDFDYGKEQFDWRN